MHIIYIFKICSSIIIYSLIHEQKFYFLPGGTVNRFSGLKSRLDSTSGIINSGSVKPKEDRDEIGCEKPSAKKLTLTLLSAF